MLHGVKQTQRDGDTPFKGVPPLAYAAIPCAAGGLSHMGAHS